MAAQQDRHEAGAIGRKHGLPGKLIVPLVTLMMSVPISAAEVLAAGSSGAAWAHARVHRGMTAPLFNQAPSMPPPVFNPSTPYTVPATPEVPVSPASPGSVFGNGR
jgi:hypothetical protein